MADNRTNVDPRYMKYNKDEVEAILDGAVQMTENERTFDVPADGVTIDTVPPDSVGTRQIEDGSVLLEDLNKEVLDNMADRVTQDDLDDFNV